MTVITLNCHTPGADLPCATVYSAAAPVHISHFSKEHRSSSHLSGMLLHSHFTLNRWRIPLLTAVFACAPGSVVCGCSGISEMCRSAAAGCSGVPLLPGEDLCPS